LCQVNRLSKGGCAASESARCALQLHVEIGLGRIFCDKDLGQESQKILRSHVKNALSFLRVVWLRLFRDVSSDCPGGYLRALDSGTHGLVMNDFIRTRG
jgi:hypothetical protein